MSNRRRKVIWGILIVIGLSLLMTGVNILQNGVGGPDGRTMAEILKVSPAEVSPRHLAQLSKSEIMQLFHAAPAPVFRSMSGEYRAALLPVGVLAPVSGYYTHHFFGPGRWVGKAFSPQDDGSGWGYNIFAGDGGNRFRTRKMDTRMGPSRIDGRVSFHLVYKAHNGGLVESMQDEIRQVNDSLFICMGYMGAGGGPINPAPFILYGKPSPWVGLDKEQS